MGDMKDPGERKDEEKTLVQSALELGGKIENVTDENGEPLMQVDKYAVRNVPSQENPDGRKYEILDTETGETDEVEIPED